MFLSALGRDLGTQGTCVRGVRALKVGQQFAMWSALLQVSLFFFPGWGEHSGNHEVLRTGEDGCQVCGHRPLLHQSTMGLAQEWTPPR
jgi:hypothetical protein